MAKIAFADSACDNLPIVVGPDEQTLYDALMAIKPASMTRNAWAVRAGVNRTIFADIKKRGNANHDTIAKLLDAVGVSWADFDASLAAPGVERAARERRDAFNDPHSVFRHDRPRDVPVRGTPSCGDYEVDGHHVEAVEMDLGEVVDYVRRPASLDSRQDVYAIYFTGFSMVPRFEPGEVAYVDTRRPPSIGDYVVLQLTGQRGDDQGVVSALVKRLSKQTADYVELEQFNPALVFKVERRRIAAMHRIFPLAELVGV